MSESPQQAGITFTFLVRVVVKGAVLFIILNMLFAFLNPEPALGKISGYNWLFPGRPRFPFGEVPEKAYSFSLYNLNAMIASHEVSGSSEESDEIKVMMVGDSSVWGILLQPEETTAGMLENQLSDQCGEKPIEVYNLGYPTLSLAKDLLVMEETMRFKPDLILWLVTLEAFPVEKQLVSPLVANNQVLVNDLIERYGLKLDTLEMLLPGADIWRRSIIGQRRSLADLLRLQLYGAAWAATGVDQYYPAVYDQAQRDLDADDTFYDLTPEDFEAGLALDVLRGGFEISGKTPIVLVNEPILVSQGENSNIRYNFYYPRWAYDKYRQVLSDYAVRSGWQYVDLWDIVPETEFTNSAIHLTPAGTEILVETLEKIVLEQVCE